MYACKADKTIVQKINHSTRGQSVPSLNLQALQHEGRDQNNWVSVLCSGSGAFSYIVPCIV